MKLTTLPLKPVAAGYEDSSSTTGTACSSPSSPTSDKTHHIIGWGTTSFVPCDLVFLIPESEQRAPICPETHRRAMHGSCLQAQLQTNSDDQMLTSKSNDGPGSYWELNQLLVRAFALSWAKPLFLVGAWESNAMILLWRCADKHSASLGVDCLCRNELVIQYFQSTKASQFYVYSMFRNPTLRVVRFSVLCWNIRHLILSLFSFSLNIYTEETQCLPVWKFMFTNHDSFNC